MERAIAAFDRVLDAECVELSHIIADLGEMANQLQQVIPVIHQPSQSYPSLDRVVAAIAHEQDETEALQLLDATQSLLEDLNRQIETTLQRSRSEVIGCAIEAWRAQTSKEPHRYNMERSTELMREWQDEQTVTRFLPEIQSVIDSLGSIAAEGVSQPHRYPMERVAGLVQQWQEERNIEPLVPELQSIVESLSRNHPPSQYPCLDRVVKGLTDLEDRHHLQHSTLIVQLRSLVEDLDHRYSHPYPSPHEYCNMERAATYLCQTRAEDEIAHHLNAFKELAAQWAGQIRNRPELQNLSEAIRALRHSVSEANTAINTRVRHISAALEQLEMSATPKPQKLTPFWEPQYPAQPPDHIARHHWEEFQRSAIHLDLIALNAESVSGMEVYERLLSDRLSTMGSGQFVTVSMSREMEKYAQVAEEGWWGKAGIDAQSLTTLQGGAHPLESTWGCFKPDTPRIDAEKSERKGYSVPIKYEHPAKAPRRIYLPHLPDTLAERIYAKYQIQPTAVERKSGFWHVVKQHNVPITITEGIKKTWASLSQGEVTIGVSGVNGIYHAKDASGNRLLERQLNEDVAVFTEVAKQLDTFATPGREFRFAYDKDDDPKTVRNVRRDLVRGIELLQERGCTCKIVQWERDKGLDDLIVNQGAIAYAKAQSRAVPADAELRHYYRYQYQVIAHQVRDDYPQAPQQVVDAEVYLRAIAKGDLKDGDRWIRESDWARTLSTPEQVEAYVNQMRTHAHHIRQQYQAQHLEQQTAEGMVNTGDNNPTQEAQSAQGRSHSQVDEDKVHSEETKERASRPKLRPRSARVVTMSEQNALNQQSVEPFKWIAKHIGEPNLADNSYTWEAQGYRFWLKGEHLKVTRKGSERVLEAKEGVVEGTVTQKEFEVFKAIILKQSEHLTRKKLAQQQPQLQQQRMRSIKGRNLKR